ncbi:MAG: helix-turn-helix protein [Solirubrobacterales bacterium]|jgi:excisionase family DNA binding protein|nr:helix-turn-helix protein [Solirubrobacterales bacterium]
MPRHAPYNRLMDAPARQGNRLGLTTSQAAQHLGVSLSTVRRWSDQGFLVGYRTPGGQRRFSAEQLDAFLRSLDQAPRV